MTTTATPAVPVAAPSPPHDNAGGSYAVTAVQTSQRTLFQFFRTPQVLVMGSVQGPMFLLMFRYVFGGAISTNAPISYVDFLVPGFLVTAILWTGMSSASGIAEDASTGVFDRLRSLPVPRSAVLVGRSMADVGLISWSVFVTGIVGFLVGFRTDAPVLNVVAGFGIIILGAAAFSWVFLVVGLVAGNAQAAQGISMLVVPFSFISSANVPVSSMPGWMQPFAANQPVTVLINAVRCLMLGGAENVGIGHDTGYWVMLSFVWCIGIALVFGAIATARFSRQR